MQQTKKQHKKMLMSKYFTCACIHCRLGSIGSTQINQHVKLTRQVHKAATFYMTVSDGWSAGGRIYAWRSMLTHVWTCIHACLHDWKTVIPTFYLLQQDTNKNVGSHPVSLPVDEIEVSSTFLLCPKGCGDNSLNYFKSHF